MPIYNRDGSVYKLRHPNPIIKAQNVWDDFKIHNMNFEETTLNEKLDKKPTSKIDIKTIVIVDEKPPEKIPVNIPEYKEPEPVKFQAVNPEPMQEIDTEPVIRPTQINEKLASYKKIVFHCLPSSVKTTIDDLYMEKTYKVTYGKKFTFEAIIVEQTDLYMIFWTHLQNIEKFSILYPKNNEKRWWKVESFKNAPEGYFLKCLPSDEHPDFSAH